MINVIEKPLAQGKCGADGHMVEADGVLRDLQIACGGDIPGELAIPELADLVRKIRTYGFRIARRICAFDGESDITAWVELTPHFSVFSDATHDDTGPANFSGVKIAIFSWQTQSAGKTGYDADPQKHEKIGKRLAELTARLDERQNVISVEADAPDLIAIAKKMNENSGEHWTQFVTIEDYEALRKADWLLTNGISCNVAGSNRSWQAHLEPLERVNDSPSGFLLYLTSDQSPEIHPEETVDTKAAALHLIANDLSPVLRQPITRIIANAETIQTKLAGPIADEYSEYASDISSAAKHLLNLIDDLGDLEIVEDDNFTTEPDSIDLAELARRASGILRMRASEKGITIATPPKGVSQPATGEFRRVLQVLLNVLGNAIRYAPEQSQIWICLDQSGDTASITIADQGVGLSDKEQSQVFGKFERLGRSGDGGSGLGLYISRRLARAMRGDLTVESARGQGARFTLSLPLSD